MLVNCLAPHPQQGVSTQDDPPANCNYRLLFKLPADSEWPHLPLELTQGPPSHLPSATWERFIKQIPLQGTLLKTVVLKVGVPKVGVFGNVRRHSWLSQFGGQRVLLASNGSSPGLLTILELHKMTPATGNFLPQMLRNPTC